MQRNTSIHVSSFLQCNFHVYFLVPRKVAYQQGTVPVLFKYQESLLIIKKFIPDDIRDLLSWSLVVVAAVAF